MSIEEVRDGLGECSKEALVEAMVEFIFGRKGKAVKAIEKQADNIVDFLNDTNLVEKISEKDDKTFDRGKMFLTDLAELELRLEELKKGYIPQEAGSNVVKKANHNSALNFFKKEG
jgi:hypothetical protein